jgi:D-glycero-D-manno-heptose 1,7-bisphosphate phosphatase
MKLIILDRDGVINNESREFIKSPAECIFIPGSLAAIAKLTVAGYTIVVATNQSGVGRGYFSLDTLNQIHQKINDELAKLGGKINKFYFCPHLPDADCACRKPKPGMFKQIEQDFNIQIADLKPVFIGDSLRDVELGLATGCRMYLVTSAGGDGQETLHKLSAEQKQQINIVENLATVVEEILV